MPGRWPLVSALVAVLLLTLLPAAPGRAVGAEIQVDLGAGYRTDDFDWNIAGNGVNVLSELTWRDLEIFQLVLGGRLLLDPDLDARAARNRLPPWRAYLRGSLGYGWIGEGTVQDSDFSAGNRTQEFSRSVNQADDGHVLDAAIGGGIQFRFRDDAVRLAPLLGLSYHEQKLTLSDGVQVVSRPDLSPPGVAPHPLGPLPPTLASSYKAEWWGPWVGADLEVLPPASRLGYFATAEFHWVADYQAVADWNLRQDFAHPRSFEHASEDGWGVALAGGARLKLTSRLGVFLRADYQDWKIEEGTDRVFFANGTQAVTRLNEVNWESVSVTAGFEGRF